MNRILVVVLILSIVGNFVGVYVLYKLLKSRQQVAAAQEKLDVARSSADHLSDLLDRMYSKRMVFLHHSVGAGILYDGGLRDSLLNMGISVKGATYGDEIGEKTDIGHWPSKFRKEMDKILGFRAHPDRYYDDGTTNDIVMFKSCFPNSDISGDGKDPGDPSAGERTVANFKAAFESIRSELAKAPDRLFVYLTAPPLSPEESSAENAARARAFNDWLLNEFQPAYQKETGLGNFVVFDLYGVLAGQDGFLRPEYRWRAGDSHPNTAGNRAAASKFMEWFEPVWQQWEADTGV